MSDRPFDAIAGAAVQPLRLAWDGVQIYVLPDVLPDEIDAVIDRLIFYRDKLKDSAKTTFSVKTQ